MSGAYLLGLALEDSTRLLRGGGVAGLRDRPYEAELGHQGQHQAADAQIAEPVDHLAGGQIGKRCSRHGCAKKKEAVMPQLLADRGRAPAAA
jgi:hypothetical protein